MDPVSHTLTGAALACTGLQERSRLGRATLIIGANLPDIDAVTYFFDGVESLAIRRGVTHGVVAMVVLPVLLALAMKGLATLWRGPPGRPEASFRQLLLLSAIAVATHPALDFLNNYGMRWLMPFVDRWSYGDTLFIIDPLVWIILLGGVLGFVFRRKRLSRSHPAITSLIVLALYILASAGGTLAARQAVHAATTDEPPRRLMASPVFMGPLQRRLVLEYAGEYRFGTVTLLPTPSVELDPMAVAKGDPRDLERAAATKDGRIFLHWARFPFTEGEDDGDARIIRVMDARYVREWDVDFATLRLEVPKD